LSVFYYIANALKLKEPAASQEESKEGENDIRHPLGLPLINGNRELLFAIYF